MLGKPVGVAKVTAVSDDGAIVYIRYANGYLSHLYNGDLGADVDDIVAVYEEGAEFAPEEVWPSDTWVGVVRAKNEDLTLVDGPSGLRTVRTHLDVAYDEGNTVRVDAEAGVLDVLAEHPVRLIDLSAPDESSVRDFEVDLTSQGPTRSDFGGLDDVVRQARRHIELPLRERDRLVAIRSKPVRGVLFTGAPGTGKTLLAQIIARETGAAFFKVSGPEVFSKYYGQSAEILRLVFRAAEQKDAAVIFFDEIDSVATSRSESSHEESQRVVAQLLTLMDGVESATNIIVIAATNRPDALDPALRRPGRFDLEINFPTPDLKDRKAILQRSAARLATTPPLPVEWLAEQTAGWTGAELAAIWTEAALYAAEDERDRIVDEDVLGGFQRARDQRKRSGASTGGG